MAAHTTHKQTGGDVTKPIPPAEQSIPDRGYKGMNLRELRRAADMENSAQTETSTPTRNAFSGVVPLLPVQAPAVLGSIHWTDCSKPGPSSGTRT